MVSEYIIDQCLTICCSLKDNDKRCKSIFESMNRIFEWYKKEIEEKSIPLSFKDKFDLVYYLGKYRSQVKNFVFSDLIEKISLGKFKDYVDTMKLKYVSLSEEEIIKFHSMLLTRRKISDLLIGKSKLDSLINDIDASNFSDDEEIIEKWGNQISELHSNLLTVKKQETANIAKRLDLVEDDYQPILEVIRSSVDPNRLVKTGFEFFNDSLSFGGFEQKRLYLFGGSSNVGKSTMLTNLITNAVLNQKHNNSKIDTFLYITAENLIDESLIRFYCCLTGLAHHLLIKKIIEDTTFDLKKEIMKELEKNNTNVVFYYVPSRATSLKDIETLMSGVAEKYCLRALYLDYLDLIISKHGYTTEERIMQGEVSMGLKNLAVEYSIPVVTVTQVNKEGYKQDAEPSMTHIGESMKKVDNADCVIHLLNTNSLDQEYNPIHGKTKTGKKIKMTLLKQRNGTSGDHCHLLLPKYQNGEKIFNYRFEQMIEINNDISTVSYHDDMSEFM